ncbi:hypothetical protein LTR85_003037 [Meristemomyces frigidus]|nr:hypothetical protein LTR85_003037 [Meristemomyces frigidus]
MAAPDTADDIHATKMPEANDVAVKDIDRDGDLILVIGEKPKAKVRVSSIMLKHSSAVFAAMLGPHFQEGQGTFNTASPREIACPDDDATAMSDMCSLLHLKTPTALTGVGSSSPHAKRIMALAVVIDKYACHDALQLQGQALLLGWLDQYTESFDSYHSCAMAAAAYLLDHGHAFKIFTSRLVTRCDMPCSSLLRSQQGKILPLPVFLALEEKRHAAQRRISEQLPVLGAPTCSLTNIPCPPSYDEGFGRAMTAAFKLTYWPPKFDEDLSVAAAITTHQRHR